MNERFKELIERATGTGGYFNTEVFDKEKFAELLVRECMEVAIHKDDGMISTTDIAGYMAAGRANAAKMIAKHFGVE